MSIQQSRSFDGVCIIVVGCITAIADAIIRKIAIDQPSLVCCHLMGRTIDGRQLGRPGFGISISSFETQCDTIEIHSAELCVARTAVLDYFQSPLQNSLLKIFDWEREFALKPTQNLMSYFRAIAREIGLAVPNHAILMSDSLPEQSKLMHNYPEIRCLRDVSFYWKFFLNTDRKSFPNYVDVSSTAKRELIRFDRMSAVLTFQFNGQSYQVSALNASLVCRPNPNQVNPATGRVMPTALIPIHRFPSTATPHFYVPPPIIKTEDDVIYRPNLPGFENKYGMYYV